MNNFLSYCGLTDARMEASEKDLPVTYVLIQSGLVPKEKMLRIVIWHIF